MSIDVTAGTETGRRMNPKLIESQCSRRDSETYQASHTVTVQETKYTIQRVISIEESVLLIQREWIVDGNTVQTFQNERPISECIGNSAKAHSLVGFVFYEHYDPAPQTQFSSLFAAIEQDAF